MLKAADIAQFRTALLKERDALATESDAASEDRATVKLDQQSVGRLSRMDAMQRQAMAQATARRRQERESRITAALRRIEEDEFGYCQECGEDIDAKRLSFDPTVPTCIACAKG
ncbi:MAG: TraR/DksA C4-type zinc finger protein [Pseudomonadota bacterium]